MELQQLEGGNVAVSLSEKECSRGLHAIIYSLIWRLGMKKYDAMPSTLELKLKLSTMCGGLGWNNSSSSQ